MIKTLRGKWFSIPHYGSCEAINAASPANERLAAKVIIEKSRGEVSLLEQDTIENVS